MCIFSFGFHECGHRGVDHIDTSSCKYFAESEVHCQEDNPRHRNRPGGVVFSNKSATIPGYCVSCFREDKDATERAMADSMRTAKEEDDRRREARKRAKEQRERAEEEARRERKRKEEERADQVEKARLAKGREQYEQNEAERQQKEESQRRVAAAEKRRQRDVEKSKRDAEREMELKQRKKDAAIAEARRQQERAEAEERIRRQEELDEAYRREEDRKEAEHQEFLRRMDEAAERARAEKKEAERLKAVEQLRRREAELERRQREIDDHNRALTTEAQGARAREEAAKHESDKAAASELERKLASRRVTLETQPTQVPPTEQTSPIAKPPPPSSKPVVDISGVIGRHGSQEIGYGTLGGRRIPLHESQRRPEPPKTPISPPPKRGPAPINRLGGTIASSPHDYMIQQPSLVATPGTPTPDWKMNVRKLSVSKPVPAPESTGPSAELAAKLAKQKAWEAEQEKLEASSSQHPKAESEWELVNKPFSSSTAAGHPPSAPHTPAAPNSPPPTYPVVPPLAHPNIASASPPPMVTKPKPPVPVKRMSSITSPAQTFSPAQKPSVQTPSIPTPPPISSLPSRLRVDSAAPSPQVGSKKGGSSDWDDSGSESEDEEDRFGGDGAWDEKDGNLGRKYFSPDDVFGEQRRKGWKAV